MDFLADFEFVFNLGLECVHGDGWGKESERWGKTIELKGEDVL
jgi:hypothetical protein